MFRVIFKKTLLTIYIKILSSIHVCCDLATANLEVVVGYMRSYNFSTSILKKLNQAGIC